MGVIAEPKAFSVAYTRQAARIGGVRVEIVTVPDAVGILAEKGARHEPPAGVDRRIAAIADEEMEDCSRREVEGDRKVIGDREDKVLKVESDGLDPLVARNRDLGWSPALAIFELSMLHADVRSIGARPWAYRKSLDQVVAQHDRRARVDKAKPVVVRDDPAAVPVGGVVELPAVRP